MANPAEFQTVPPHEGVATAEAQRAQGRQWRLRASAVFAAALLAAGLLSAAVAYLPSRSPAGTMAGSAGGNEFEQLHADPCAGMGKAEIELLKETLGEENPCHKHGKKSGSSEPAAEATTPAPEAEPSEDPEPAAPERRESKTGKLETKCAAFGENCTKKQCCEEPGMQCYEKGWGWSQCRQSCTAGPDPRDVADGGAWSCKELGPRTKGPGCSEEGENCLHSKCCKGIGFQCFEQNSAWAGCKRSCEPGVDMTHKDNKPWSCKKLGDFTYGRAPWVSKKCSKTLTECTKTKCCSETGAQCYENVPDFASCAKTCEDPWTCKEFGLRTPPNVAEANWDARGGAKLAPWVDAKCSGAGADCSASHCCKDPGLQCYEKGAGKSAVCRFGCVQGPDPSAPDSAPWTCKKLGPRTPGTVDLKHVKPKKAAAWVAKECSGDGEDCTDSKCCKGAAMQCYRKDDKVAKCKAGCNPSALELHPWSCETLGPRTPVPWKSPSVFCFSVMRKTGEEPGLMKAQLLKGRGIFACDDYAAFSSGETKWILGEGPRGVVEVFPFEEAEVGKSRDGTAGNTELFINVWDQVRKHGAWYEHDWTVKADPDAVVMPERLRKHLEKHTGGNLYLKNCDKQNGMKPMMFGSLEALSRRAMQTYFWGESRCRELEWESWGEDLYLGKCLDLLGSEGKEDLTLVSDGVCLGVDCSSDAAVFHPKKTVESWMACLAEAEGRKVPKASKAKAKAKAAGGRATAVAGGRATAVSGGRATAVAGGRATAVAVEDDEGDDEEDDMDDVMSDDVEDVLADLDI